MNRYFLLFSCICCFLFSCSSSSDLDDAPVTTEQQMEETKQTWNDIRQYLESQGTSDIDDVEQYVKNHIEGVKSVTRDGNTLYVFTDAGKKIQLDFTAYPQYKSAQLNETELTNAMNSFSTTEKLPTPDKSACNTSDYFGEELWTLQSLSGTYTKFVPTSKKENHASKTTSSNKVRLSRRNVAVWCPWKEYYDFETDEDYIKDCVKKTNNGGNVWVFNGFNPSSFAALADFDVVVISAHGDKDGRLIIPMSCIQKDEKTIEAYADEWEKGNAWPSEFIFEVKPGVREWVPCMVLSKSFFDKWLPKLTNTIIYTITCYAGKSNGEFMSSVMNKDVADYFASDIQCTSEKILKEFSNYYPKLSKGVSSNKAFAQGKGFFTGEVKIRDVQSGMDVTESYKYSEYGKKKVSYSVPFALGIKLNNENKKIKSSNSTGDVTDVIVKSQVRCSKDVRSSLNSIEAGICLKNMTTKEVKYIPFSSSNIVSSSIDDYSETSAKNYEAKLTNLSNEDDYMYCTYIKNGTETILSDECYKLFSSLCPDENHPHAIDMGAAGVWACCNVGANSPEEYGGYYAWGETSEKSTYDWENLKYYPAYQTYYGEFRGYTKYCTREECGYGSGYFGSRFDTKPTEGFTDNKTELDLSDDVAHQQWGSSWRMPSEDQLRGLREKCRREWTQVNNVYGQLFTAISNGNRIFLPAAGYRNGTSLNYAGSKGYYWSRMLDDAPDYPYYLYFGSDGVGITGYDQHGGTRNYGRTVRPVRP